MSTSAVAISGVEHVQKRTPQTKRARPVLSEVEVKKRKVLAEELIQSTRDKIVDLVLEAFIRRHRHGLELSAYVVRKLRQPGFDEKLIDDVVAGELSKHRSAAALMSIAPDLKTEIESDVWETL